MKSIKSLLCVFFVFTIVFCFTGCDNGTTNGNGTTAGNNGSGSNGGNYDNDNDNESGGNSGKNNDSETETLYRYVFLNLSDYSVTVYYYKDGNYRNFSLPSRGSNSLELPNLDDVEYTPSDLVYVSLNNKSVTFRNR